MSPLILLIDDSPVIHSLVRAHLGDDDVMIRSAYDGETGLSLALTCAPDLILLDVDMPAIDGFEVCRRLNENPLTTATPVIFLTGAGESGQKVLGFECGADDYITKPFDPPEFTARVRHALRAKLRLDVLRSRRVTDFISKALQPARNSRAA